MIAAILESITEPLIALIEIFIDMLQSAGTHAEWKAGFDSRLCDRLMDNRPTPQQITEYWRALNSTLPTAEQAAERLTIYLRATAINVSPLREKK
jgi:hypothetical protein